MTLALLVAAAVRENYLTEWRVLQRQYRGLLVAKASDEAERTLARRSAVEIRQIVVPDLRAVDRCVSCHLGLDDPRMTDVPQPFRSHPAHLLDTHGADDFGCTICHGGQGRATTKHEAHADRGEVFWERPLLPAPLAQSACGVCHDPASLKERGAPVLARGLELFRENGCSGCHNLGGRGGSLGPPLDHVGDKGKQSFAFAHVAGERTVWNWHRQHLRDPRKVVPDSRMPAVRLGEREIDALTAYLLSLRSANLTERMTPRDKYEERYRGWHPPAVSGAELYRQYCFACHADGVETVLHDTLRIAIPSVRNPDFQAVATEELLFRSIREGRPGTVMPAWGPQAGGLTDEEIRRLAAYLLEGRTSRRGVTFVLSNAADLANGMRLFEANCASCHGLAAGVGEAPRLGGPGFQQTYSDALIGHTIKYGRAGTLMNPFGQEAGGDLTDQQISDIVAFIRTLR